MAWIEEQAKKMYKKWKIIFENWIQLDLGLMPLPVRSGWGYSSVGKYMGPQAGGENSILINMKAKLNKRDRGWDKMFNVINEICFVVEIFCYSLSPWVLSGIMKWRNEKNWMEFTIWI